VEASNVAARIAAMPGDAFVPKGATVINKVGPPIPTERIPLGAQDDYVEATWAEEVFSPVQFNVCKHGPFTARVRPMPNESHIAAFKRAFSLAEQMANETRAKKLNEFTDALRALKGAAR
jgi:hypothetical protein